MTSSDRGRDQQILGVGAVQELERLAALVAGGRVRGDDALAGRDVDPAELVTERARQLAQEDGVAAPEGLEVGAVRQCHLDLHEHVAGAGLRAWDLVEPQIPDAVEAQRSHGVKTTFSAAPERYSSRPSWKRSSGRTTGAGTSISARSSAASRMCRGVAEREPVSVSSRR